MPRCSISKSIRSRSRRRRRRALWGAAAGGAPTLLADRAQAHAFGQRYDLPLPLDIYLYAAGAVVLLTFVIFAIFVRPARQPRRWQRDLPALLPTGVRTALRLLAAALGIAILVLVIAAGLFGAQSATGNIAPLIVWVLWWVGFLFLCTFVINLWPAFNPWRALFSLARMDRRHGEGEELAAPCHAVFDWCATLGFLAFAWLELVSEISDSPRGLAFLVCLYSLLTWAGMAWLGRDSWLAAVDPFHRVFHLFGRFAPLYRTEAGALGIRPPATGLLGGHPQSLGAVAFIVAVLATVTFDGFSETSAWSGFLGWVSESQTLRSPLLWLSGQGVDLLAALKTFGLLATALVFFLVFALVSYLSARLGRELTTVQTMRGFALTLLPIAIAYHLSHYLSYLLLAGQLVVPLASDPLGYGWDLFGTRSVSIDIGVIGARDVWHVAMVAIVLGHVLSVVLAHIEAARLIAGRREALLSQIPMLVLMVAFTFCSLWILSQPIVQQPD